MARAKKPGTPTSKASQASKASASGTAKATSAKPVTAEPPKDAEPVALKDPGAPKAPTQSAAASPPSATRSAADDKAPSKAPDTQSKPATTSDPDKTDAAKSASGADTAKTAEKSPSPSTTSSGGATKPGEKPAEKPSVKPSDAEIVHPVPAPIAASSKRSIFWPLVLGGLVAGVIGFLVAELNMLGTRNAADIETDLRATLNEQQTRIAALEDAPAPTAEAPAAPDLSGIEDQIAALSSDIGDIQARVGALESGSTTPQGGMTEDEISNYESELTALKSSVEAQKAEIQNLLDNAISVEEAAANASRAANVQAALTELRSAIDNGKPLNPALEELEISGVADLPDPLTAPADSGVVTMSNLQERFPDAARDALSASRQSGGAEDGLGGFLKRQLGARSVAPREGSDTDAVLSRAEAAVRDGRLTDALAEIDTLPEDAKAAMNDWLSDAETRQAAEAAVDAVSQRLTAN